MFLLSSAHLFALGSINWYARKWRITIFNFICLGFSLIFLWLYLIFVITLPKYFSYSGASAVFLSLSFLPICFIHYRIDSMKNKVEIQAYMKTMEVEAMNKSSPGEILKATRENQKKGYLLFWKVPFISNTHLAYLVNIGALVTYAILIRSEAKRDHNDLGFLNISLVIITDFILILWGLWSKTGYYISPSYVCLVVLITRVLLSVWPYYWIIIHSTVFLMLLMLFVTVWILKNIHVDSKESRRNKKQQELLGIILNCPELHQDLSKELEGMNPDELVKQKHNQLWNAVCELVPIVILFLAFVVYGAIIWTTNFDRALARRITIDRQSLHQGIFIGLAIAIFFSYILMFLWFRLFQLNSYQSNWFLLSMAIGSYALIVLIGIVYGNIVLNNIDNGTKVSAITVFWVAPLCIFTIWIFYGIWMHNYYNLYQNRTLTKIRKSIEEHKDQERNDSNSDLVNEQNQQDERKKIKTKYNWTPRYFNDIVIFLAFWLNVIGLFIGFLICVIEYQPQWVVVFIWAWAMLLEFGALGIIRFMHHGYSRRDEWIWICICVWVVFYICSAVSFGFGIKRASANDEAKYIIAWVVIHVGILIVALFLTLGYKIRQEIRSNSWAKVASIALMIIILLVIGLLLIFLAQWYASGWGILTLWFYLLLKIIETESFMKNWLSEKWWNIVELSLLAIVVGIVTIILLISLNNQKKAVLEILSYSSYLLVAIFCFMFYLEYTKNEKNSKNQIYVYSTQLLPMLKYETSQSKLKFSNA